ALTWSIASAMEEAALAGEVMARDKRYELRPSMRTNAINMAMGGLPGLAWGDAEVVCLGASGSGPPQNGQALACTSTMLWQYSQRIFMDAS
ncbi:MAG: hypothetical protein IJC31_03130, partial [Spirochaetaceae bacterium]|nr:hypothetical protein [Spirochaetaceae bacterium]